jgi:hypothetical protein
LDGSEGERKGGRRLTLDETRHSEVTCDGVLGEDPHLDLGLAMIHCEQGQTRRAKPGKAEGRVRKRMEV